MLWKKSGRQVKLNHSSGSRSLLPLLRQAPHLDECAGVPRTEVLKGDREALPCRVQVVLDYLEVEARLPVNSVTQNSSHPSPSFSKSPSLPNLGHHKRPQKSLLPTHTHPGDVHTSVLYVRCHFPSVWRKNSKNGSDFPRKSC